jgi:hypothetical protein
MLLFPIILLLAFVSGFILPWWVACILAFIAAWFFGKTSGRTFIAGFAALALAWTALALLKSIPNDHLLATRVAKMFQLPYWWLLLIVTALIGGVVGGMSALSGLLVKRVFEK